MSDTKVDPIVFVTAVRTAYGRSRARLLIDSIQTFAGALGECPIWLFEADPHRTPCEGLAGGNVQVIPLNDVPEEVRDYLFADKVYACAQAEASLAGEARSLVWIDPGVLVVNPPVLFDLGEEYDAAVRPVHIQNVGLEVTEPLDVFWKKIYAAVGVEDIQTTVTSFVDEVRLRAYFNSHAFAVNPSTGLLNRWREVFHTLVCDEAYQQATCQDERHQVFLFQAILSTLLVTWLEPGRVRILPPVYNYPYNLQASVPEEHRAEALNEVVSIAYEDRSLDPEVIEDIQVEEPLRGWLRARVEEGLLGGCQSDIAE